INPYLLQLWDDIFHLCRRYDLKILLTPYDTFWMWNHWRHHPYNKMNGGPCGSRNQWLLCPDTRERIKRRFDFVTQRWGGDGTILAWDLWNESHPAHAANSAEGLWEFVEDISSHLRNTEQRLHGASHLQTVSVFLPVIAGDKRIADVVYRHPCLDMANIHLYEHGTIDDPRNTVDPAVSTGKLIAQAIAEVPSGRAVFDSEHGPIHAFKDRHQPLSEEVDDEYFRHIQWAHLATGAAGGGMRWPNRNPHTLTSGMRQAQKVLADFLAYVDWTRFRRRSLTGKLTVVPAGIECFGCADPAQAIVYLLRRDTLQRNGMLNRSAPPVQVNLRIPGLEPGAYRITAWDTVSGFREQFDLPQFSGETMSVDVPPFVADVALAIVRRR
ncbi:MAG TPA: hypothetical protein VER03_19295, partial [Bryobacteraceae bacterium]|nr:hypothetical protein [Bryobacteraceae bacterium]